MTNEQAAQMPSNWPSLLPDIFSRCVSHGDPARLAMRTPFVYGEFIYATNGRIIVRMPRPDWASEIAENNATPVPTKLPWSRTDYAPIWCPIPMRPPIMEGCSACNGNGCELCNEGLVEAVKVVWIGPVSCSSDLLRIIDEAGGRLYLHRKYWPLDADSGRWPPVYFKIPGSRIEGLMMTRDRIGGYDE